MSDSPYGAMPPSQPAWPPPAFPPPNRPSRAPLFIAIAVALIALAVAIGSWFRPTPEPTRVAAPTYTDSEITDAKEQVCDAFKLVHDAIVISGTKSSGDDPNAKLALDANGRLAFFAGAQYLGDLTKNLPAAPSDLAVAAQQYSSAYKQLSLVLLSDRSPDQMDKSVLDSGDAANDKLKQLCQ